MQDIEGGLTFMAALFASFSGLHVPERIADHCQRQPRLRSCREIRSKGVERIQLRMGAQRVSFQEPSIRLNTAPAVK